MAVSKAAIHRFITGVAIGAILPLLAAAQSHGGAAAHGSAVGRAGAPVVRVAPMPRAPAPLARAPIRAQAAPSNTIRVVAQPRFPGNTGRPHTMRRANIFPAVGFTDFQDVPGLGFDFPHLAAINANRPHHGRRFAGEAPFFGGFLLTSPSVIIEQPVSAEETAPDVDATTEPAVDEQPVVRRHRKIREPEAETGTPAAEPTSQRDMEQFVFVRRDGSLVFAVAYTWVDNTLRYITPDGLRRTIDRDALDLNATQQFNEQRGVSFRAPA
jgi:hypothetical protein